MYTVVYSTVSSKFDFFSMSKTIQWDKKLAIACICKQKKKYEKKFHYKLHKKIKNVKVTHFSNLFLK